jgi:hypothetical protein
VNGYGDANGDPHPLVYIETEMAYTTWDESCKDPTVIPNGDFRECRRPKNHKGPHASGHSANNSLIVWN